MRRNRPPLLPSREEDPLPIPFRTHRLDEEVQGLEETLARLYSPIPSPFEPYSSRVPLHSMPLPPRLSIGELTGNQSVAFANPHHVSLEESSWSTPKKISSSLRRRRRSPPRISSEDDYIPFSSSPLFSESVKNDKRLSNSFLRLFWDDAEGTKESLSAVLENFFHVRDDLERVRSVCKTSFEFFSDEIERIVQFHYNIFLQLPDLRDILRVPPFDESVPYSTSRAMFSLKNVLQDTIIRLANGGHWNVSALNSSSSHLKEKILQPLCMFLDRVHNLISQWNDNLQVQEFRCLLDDHNQIIDTVQKQDKLLSELRLSLADSQKNWDQMSSDTRNSLRSLFRQFQALFRTKQDMEISGGGQQDSADSHALLGDIISIAMEEEIDHMIKNTCSRISAISRAERHLTAPTPTGVHESVLSSRNVISHLSFSETKARYSLLNSFPSFTASTQSAESSPRYFSGSNLLLYIASSLHRIGISLERGTGRVLHARSQIRLIATSFGLPRNDFFEDTSSIDSITSSISKIQQDYDMAIEKRWDMYRSLAMDLSHKLQGIHDQVRMNASGERNTVSIDPRMISEVLRADECFELDREAFADDLWDSYLKFNDSAFRCFREYSRSCVESSRQASAKKLGDSPFTPSQSFLFSPPHDLQVRSTDSRQPLVTDSLLEHVQQAQVQKTDMLTQLNDLTRQLRKLEAQVTYLESSNESLRSERERLTEENERWSVEFSRAQSRLDCAISDLAHRDKQISAEEMEKRISSLETENELVKKLNADWKNKCEALQNSMSFLESELNRSRSVNESLSLRSQEVVKEYESRLVHLRDDAQVQSLRVIEAEALVVQSHHETEISQMQLQELKAEISRKVQSLERERELIEEERVLFSSKIKELTAEINASKDENQRLERDKRKFELEKSSAEAVTKQSDDIVHQFRDEIQERQNRIDELHVSLLSTEHSLHIAEKECRHLEHVNAKLLHERDSLIRELEDTKEELVTIKKRRKEADESVNSLQREYDRLLNVNEQLELEKESLRSKKLENEDSLCRVRAELEALRISLERKDSSISDLERESRMLHESLKTSKSSASALEVDVERLKQELSSRQELSISHAQSALDSTALVERLQREVETERRKGTDIRMEIASVREENEFLHKELRELRNVSKNTRFELETLEGKLAAEKTRVEGVTERCSLFEAQLKDAESRCLEYSQECGEKTVEIQKLETHVSQLQDERNRLLTRIEEIHGQFIRKEQKLNEEIRDLVASSDVASKSMITRELELKSFMRAERSSAFCRELFSFLRSCQSLRRQHSSYIALSERSAHVIQPFPPKSKFSPSPRSILSSVLRSSSISPASLSFEKSRRRDRRESDLSTQTRRSAVLTLVKGIKRAQTTIIEHRRLERNWHFGRDFLRLSGVNSIPLLEDSRSLSARNELFPRIFLRSSSPLRPAHRVSIQSNLVQNSLSRSYYRESIASIRSVHLCDQLRRLQSEMKCDRERTRLRFTMFSRAFRKFSSLSPILLNQGCTSSLDPLHMVRYHPVYNLSSSVFSSCAQHCKSNFLSGKLSGLFLRNDRVVSFFVRKSSMLARSFLCSHLRTQKQSLVWKESQSRKFQHHAINSFVLAGGYARSCSVDLPDITSRTTLSQGYEIAPRISSVPAHSLSFCTASKKFFRYHVPSQAVSKEENLRSSYCSQISQARCSLLCRSLRQSSFLYSESRRHANLKSILLEWSLSRVPKGFQSRRNSTISRLYREMVAIPLISPVISYSSNSNVYRSFIKDSCYQRNVLSEQRKLCDSQLVRGHLSILLYSLKYSQVCCDELKNLTRIRRNQRNLFASSMLHPDFNFSTMNSFKRTQLFIPDRLFDHRHLYSLSNHVQQGRARTDALHDEHTKQLQIGILTSRLRLAKSFVDARRSLLMKRPQITFPLCSIGENLLEKRDSLRNTFKSLVQTPARFSVELSSLPVFVSQLMFKVISSSSLSEQVLYCEDRVISSNRVISELRKNQFIDQVRSCILNVSALQQLNSRRNILPLSLSRVSDSKIASTVHRELDSFSWNRSAIRALPIDLPSASPWSALRTLENHSNSRNRLLSKLDLMHRRFDSILVKNSWDTSRTILLSMRFGKEVHRLSKRCTSLLGSQKLLLERAHISLNSLLPSSPSPLRIQMKLIQHVGHNPSKIASREHDLFFCLLSSEEQLLVNARENQFLVAQMTAKQREMRAELDAALADVLALSRDSRTASDRRSRSSIKLNDFDVLKEASSFASSEDLLNAVESLRAELSQLEEMHEIMVEKMDHESVLQSNSLQESSERLRQLHTKLQASENTNNQLYHDLEELVEAYRELDTEFSVVEARIPEEERSTLRIRLDRTELRNRLHRVNALRQKLETTSDASSGDS